MLKAKLPKLKAMSPKAVLASVEKKIGKPAQIKGFKKRKGKVSY